MLINARYTEIHQKFNFENIRDLICILIDLIPNHGAIHHSFSNVGISPLRSSTSSLSSDCIENLVSETTPSSSLPLVSGQN